MNSQLKPLDSPLVSPLPPLKNRVARWRWWVALFLIASLPILVALSALRRNAAPRDEGAMLPADVPGLLLFCALQLGAFGVFWAVFWAFSRADKDQLFLRFRGVQTLVWGVGYSILMRFGLGFIALMALVALTLLGFDLKTMFAALEANGQGMKEAFAPAFASQDPLYRFLLVTLISFVVAGLREELWRAATLAAMLHLAPAKWSQNLRNGVALGVSSVLFGLGHFYQGAIGMVVTTLLGLALGAILLRHQSIWPAIVAHGCFNAASFAALSALGTK